MCQHRNPKEHCRTVGGEIQESVCLCVCMCIDVCVCMCILVSINRCLVSETVLPEDCQPCGQFLCAVPLPSRFLSFLSCPHSSTLSYPLSNIALSSVVFGYDGPVA